MILKNLLYVSAAFSQSDCVGRCDVVPNKPLVNGQTTQERMMFLMEEDIKEEIRRRESLSKDEISIVGSMIKCVEGFAAGYPCNNADLYSVLSHKDMHSFEQGNDIWGWTDPETGREYALVGQSDGTAFVDITDPTNPILKGRGL